MAQKSDSPLKFPDRNKVTIQPRELLMVFKSIKIMPPENLPLNFSPSLKLKYKNNIAEIKGNN